MQLRFENVFTLMHSYQLSTDSLIHGSQLSTDSLFSALDDASEEDNEDGDSDDVLLDLKLKCPANRECSVKKTWMSS